MQISHRHPGTVNKQNEHSKTQNFTLAKPIEFMCEKVPKI